MSRSIGTEVPAGPASGSNARCDGGFLTVQLLVAVAVSLVLVTSMLNLIVFQYGKGVVRAALDEGVRTGGRATATVADCQARAAAAIDDLLGALGDEVSISCAEAAGQMTAHATVTFRGWLATVPDWRFELRGASVKEQEP